MAPRKFQRMVMAAIGFATSTALASEPEATRDADVALGFQLDLFPSVISAVNGEFGYDALAFAPFRTS